MFNEKKDRESIVIEELSSNEELLVSKTNDFGAHIDAKEYGSTKRKLSSRHVALMIIGQSIGTGLYIGLKIPLMDCGSLSLFLGFVLWSVTMIYPLMMAVGEMCSFLPIKGSFLHYAARWLDPAMGFAVTLIYLYTCLMFLCFEVVAFASVVGFWTTISPAVFISIGLVTILFFNVFGVNWYGEIEFFSSILKVLLIVGLMLFTLITMCGANPIGYAYGFSNWPQGGLMHEFLVKGATGRFLGLWNVLIYAAFSCGGPDMLGMVAGEISQPRKSIALAAKRTYIRIYLFYIGGVFFMATICSSINPQLLAARATSGVASSPWVIGIKSLGVNGLDSVVNAVIATSAWSCGNGFVYGAARSAYSASLAGYLPKIFAKCLPNGCPIYAVCSCMLIACLSYLSVSESGNVVFNWFINLSTTGLLCTFSVIWLCYFKFKKAVVAQNSTQLDSKYFKLNKFLYPWLPYWAFGFNNAVLFFNGFWIFFPGEFTVSNLFTSYFAPVLFIALFVGWKLIKKTKWRTVMEADITTGLDEIEAEEILERDILEAEPKKTGFFWVASRKLGDFLFN